MRVFNMSQTAFYLSKSLPTVYRWIKEERLIGDATNKFGKPLFFESTLKKIQAEIEKDGTPGVKTKEKCEAI